MKLSIVVGYSSCVTHCEDNNMHKLTTLFFTIVILAGCAEMMPKHFEPSSAHISSEPEMPTANIPELVQQVPIVPVPEAPVELAKYTVVVHEVPVKEILFALARDAEINVDIHPLIDGFVTINAVDQTLPQILNRIARQVSLRYEIEDNNLIITPDAPYVRSYNVGYLNLSRETAGTVTVSTQIASGSSGEGGGGVNTSTTNINSESNHNFWENLRRSILSVMAMPGESNDDAVVINPESGVVSVRATASQHQQVQGLIDQVLESVQRQVLVQATVVEVDLSDQFQAGIDWSIVDLSGSGFSVSTGAPGSLTSPLATSPGFVLDYLNPNSGGERIMAAVSLLSEFGNTRVLSSPQIMVLNNHTAVLKVVENFVYFEVEQEVIPATSPGVAPTFATTTTPQTVPVGLVMTVTPQISGDSSVTFNVRPTISSVVRTELDPNPSLTIENRIPVIRVREMESILRVNSNQVAVLGGLMQDTFVNNDRQTPFAGDIPILGNLFKSRRQESRKTELVIFLRPIVIRNASIDGELSDYRRFLETSTSNSSGLQGLQGR
jgi:MSHA biogenesis protein MshL